MRGGGVASYMSSTCVQGGLPRPFGGYQPNLIAESRTPTPAWPMQHTILPKQEPMEDDRNDSGINSGSDFHSSSPGSESSQDFNPTATYPSSNASNHNTQNPNTYYSTPLIARSAPVGYHTTIPSLGYHQNEKSTISQALQVPSFVNNENVGGDPSSITEKSQIENDNPLRRLQLALEHNGLIPPPPGSPKTSEHSGDEDNKSDFEGDEYDEDGLRIPRMNSHGKVKTHKCKQCEFVAITKLDFWEHTKGHIKADKLLTCPKCPFVTEYKHHLEYHLRNHFGSKPFKCDKCSYSCVNKSMLNSHMKSHSNVYQYRCADCSYATKYCHSLKLHLRKYTHKPAMVLNPDGTPNPLPIIDVYGTRRGPKQRSNKGEDSDNSPSSVLQNQFAQFMLNSSPQMPMAFPYHFLAGFQNPMTNPLLFPHLEKLGHNNQRDETSSPEGSPNQSPTRISTDPEEVLDLSKPEPSPPEQPVKNRRKGRAFKLENLPTNDSSDDDDEEEISVGEVREVSMSTDEKQTATEPKEEKIEGVTNNNNIEVPGHNSCQYCNISFGDIVLYTMHMGYHGFHNPFTCNMCGEQCKDKVSFFLHIARTPHT